MKKQVKKHQFHDKKLEVNRETIRHLNRSELEITKGGVISIRTGEFDGDI